MYAIILTGALAILLLFAIWFSKGDILSPAVLFSASFLFSAIWMLPFMGQWQLKLSEKIFWCISVGVFVFDIVCVFVAFSKWKFTSNNTFTKELKYIDIDLWKKIVFFFIELFTVVYSFYIKLKFAGGSFATVFVTMASYRANIMFYGGKTVVLPGWLNLLNSAVTAAGYWFAYVVANNYILKKSIDKMALAIFSISFINTILSTSRGGTLTYLIAFIVYFMILSRISHGSQKRVKFKIVFIAAIILFVFVVSFQAVGNLLSRGSTETTADYLVRYCGAEIPNLDDWLSHQRRDNNSILGSQTFIYVIQWFGDKLGLLDVKYDLDLPFRIVAGKNLGNVYTTFYPFIYDFGYKGLVLLSAIMAMISQGVYRKIKNTGLDYRPSRYILLYGFIAPTLLLSFFSNKFYESIFNSAFMYTFLFWIIFDYIFCDKAKKKFRIRRHL